jgi:hypothetical protein
MKNTFVYTLFSFIFIACETTKDINLPLPYGGDKFVLQGFISENEGVWAVISRTTDPNDPNGNPKVTNIKVSLFENDVFLSELKECKSSYYSNDLKIKPNLKYHITVEGMNLPKLTTPEVSVIPFVKMQKVKLVKQDSFIAVLNFDFKDEIGTNSYQVSITQYRNKIAFTNNNPFDTYFNAFSFFDDKIFEGKTKNFAQKVSLYRLENKKNTFADEIEVKFFSFSPEIKQFLESIYNVEGNGQDPYYDPLPVYNNVKGGFGIFAAYSVDTVRLKVE